jgi:hypothetical protein
MSESQAKIRLTMDGQQASREAKRVKRSVAGVGEEAGKWAASLAKTMAFSGVILGTMRSIVQAQDAARKGAADMSRSMGDASLRLSQALIRLRATEQEARAVTAVAEDNPEAVAATFERLAQSRKGRRPRGDMIDTARAAASGVFSQDEIDAAAQRGRRLDIAGREGALTPGARREIEIRREEQALLRRQRGGASDDMRLAEAELARRRQESPTAQALADLAESISQFFGIRQSDAVRGRGVNQTFSNALRERLTSDPPSETWHGRFVERILGIAEMRANRPQTGAKDGE